METPIPLSSSICLRETQEIDGLTIKAGEMMFIAIHQLHHNEDQWGEDHHIFRPERFEKSQAHHHPMSFIPFLGGKRVCIGKTFAENSFKVVLPLILKAYKELEFVDPTHYKKKPLNNITMPFRPVIKIRLN